jgi:mono/diheme cytochrome c family protein
MRVSNPKFALIYCALAFTVVPRLLSAPPPELERAQELAQALNLSFSENSSSVLFIEQGGRKYRIDVAMHSITEVSGAATGIPVVNTAFGQPSPAPARSAGQSSQPAAPQASGQALFRTNCASCHGPDGKGIRSIGTPDFVSVGMNQAHVAATIHSGRTGKMPSFTGRLSDAEIASISGYVASLAATKPDVKPGFYKAGDDVLFSLPTGRPVDSGGLYVNFSHRFPYDPAFQGSGRGGELFGLDDFSLSSIGLRYGVTQKFSVDLYRSPSFVGRPIELMAAYNLLSEQTSGLFNLTVRVSVDGQNNFRKSYTENVEGIFSRSLTRRAQIYLVPTVSINDRRVVQGGLTSSQIPDYPGINAFSLGAGGAFDIRPTVALVAEVIPTLIGADQLGIHRPPFSFGIQKKIYRHAFTFGFTNSPGTTVSERAGTDATFTGNPHGDVFKEMFLGFDLTRQIR